MEKLKTIIKEKLESLLNEKGLGIYNSEIGQRIIITTKKKFENIEKEVAAVIIESCKVVGQIINGNMRQGNDILRFEDVWIDITLDYESKKIWLGFNYPKQLNNEIELFSLETFERFNWSLPN